MLCHLKLVGKYQLVNSYEDAIERSLNELT